ncbi:lipase member M-like [Paroedura picta]
MLLVPTCTMVDTTSVVKFFLLIPDGFKRFIFGKKEFRAISRNMRALDAKLCTFPVLDKICLSIMSMCFGNNEKNINSSRMDVYAGMFPEYTSVKTILHWSQVARSGEFKYFDYGDKNKAVYNMTTPPFYKLEDMTVPTAVWTGEHDRITDLKNTKLLLSQITHLVFHKHIPKWQHADFVIGLDAPEYLYPDMFWLMEQYK